MPVGRRPVWCPRRNLRWRTGTRVLPGAFHLDTWPELATGIGLPSHSQHKSEFGLFRRNYDGSGLLS